MYSRHKKHQILSLGIIFLNPTSRQFHTITLTSNSIGPHNLEVLSVLVGCLLGYANALQNKKENYISGTKFIFKQSGRHKSYLFFLYEFFNKRGYCTNSGPRETKTILIKGAINPPRFYYNYEFNLYTYSSLNWLSDLFYLNGIKKISSEIMNYLTPMSIAFLIMECGRWLSVSKSVRISTNKFTLQEVELLRDTFKAKFNLDCTIQILTKKGGKIPKDKYSLYIKVSSVPLLRELVLPYMHSSMLYKLGSGAFERD
jgi:hypothetical protein